jgi:hypothetical protein
MTFPVQGLAYSAVTNSLNRRDRKETQSVRVSKFPFAHLVCNGL